MESDEHRYEHDELTERAIGCAFVVSNSLGHGFLEKVYENALAIELRHMGHEVQQRAPVEVRYREEIVGIYQPDLLVGRSVVLELKCVAALDRTHRAQCLNYLRATGLKTGLVINFGRPRLDVQRILA